MLSIQTSIEYFNREDLITSIVWKYGRDRNHKLWMPSFVLYSQQHFYLVRESTILLFICRPYPKWLEMGSLYRAPRNRHSSCGIFATPPILPYQIWWWTVLDILDSPNICSLLFFFNNSSLLYVIRAPHLHYEEWRRILCVSSEQGAMYTSYFNTHDL